MGGCLRWLTGYGPHVTSCVTHAQHLRGGNHPRAPKVVFVAAQRAICRFEHAGRRRALPKGRASRAVRVRRRWLWTWQDGPAVRAMQRGWSGRALEPANGFFGGMACAARLQLRPLDAFACPLYYQPPTSPPWPWPSCSRPLSRAHEPQAAADQLTSTQLRAAAQQPRLIP